MPTLAWYPGWRSVVESISSITAGPAPESAVKGTRAVHFGAVAAIETSIYERAPLPAGALLGGPAIIEQFDSTTVIPPDVRAEVDEWLNIRIYVAEESK